jgi:ribosomal protein S27E
VHPLSRIHVECTLEKVNGAPVWAHATKGSDSVINVSCGACGHEAGVAEEHAGKQIRCQECKGVIAVPGQSAPGSASPTRAKKGKPMSFPRDGRGFEIAVDTETQTASLVVGRFTEKQQEDSEFGAAGPPPLIVTPSQLAAQMPKAGIKVGVYRESIKRAFMDLMRASTIEEGKSTIIARGRQPGLSTPGSVEYAVDLTGKAIYRVEEAKEGESGIDFKNATRIETVNPDDLLATITPGVLGKAGVQLDGKPIAPEPLESLGIQAGMGVDVDHTGNVFVATSAGRPLLLDGVLSVVPIYDVEGDVDVTTGHIRFNGHVTVKGSIQDDYTVICKSLEVMGTVGAATIQCEERAVFRGGVNGQGRGTIRAGGKIAARYLNRSDVISLGGITIERGITNSKVKTIGTIRAERIIGGRMTAMGGIQVNHLGSDLGVVTYMEAGTDFRVEILDKVLAAGNNADVRELLLPNSLFFGGTVNYDDGENSDDGDDDDLLMEEEEDDDTEFGRLKEPDDVRDKRDALVEESLEEAIAMVNIEVRMHSDVVVSDGSRQREFNVMRAGPITIAVEPESGAFDISPMRALRKAKKGD